MRPLNLFPRSCQLALSILTGGVFSPIWAASYTPEPELLARAKEIHSRILTIDTHMDTPLLMMRPGFDFGKRQSVEEHFSQVDLPRMKEGGMDGGFLVVYNGQGPRNPDTHTAVKKRGMEIIDRIEAVVAENADLCALAYSADDAYRIRSEGKHVLFLGIENGYLIGRDIDMLAYYHRRGVRYFGITHAANNDLADSSTDPHGEEWFGLSTIGRAAIEECFRLGIMVDISHASDKAAWDVLAMAPVPIIATHSSSYALYPHKRNLNDPLLEAIKRNGGVVQVNMFSAYLMDVPSIPERSAAFREWFQKYGAGKALTEAEIEQSRMERRAIVERYPLPQASVTHVVDHIDHMVKVMGINHVGVSADFDGGGGVDGANHIGEMHNITVEMLKRGYTEEDLEKFWGGNAMRVLRAAEAYAAEQQRK